MNDYLLFTIIDGDGRERNIYFSGKTEGFEGCAIINRYPLHLHSQLERQAAEGLEVRILSRRMIPRAALRLQRSLEKTRTCFRDWICLHTRLHPLGRR